MYLDLEKNTMVKIKGNIIWTYHRQWSQFHMFVRCIPLGSNKRSHGWRILRLYKKEGFRSVLLKLHNFSFTLLGKIAIFFFFYFKFVKIDFKGSLTQQKLSWWIDKGFFWDMILQNRDNYRLSIIWYDFFFFFCSEIGILFWLKTECFNA